MNKLKFSVSPASFILFLCILATTPLKQLTACVLAAILHESGHIVASKALSIPISHMKLDVLGARLRTSGKLCSYPSMIALCLAGPLINFVCFAFTLPFSENFDFLHEFCLSSLSLGLLNLLPIDGFDGGRIVHSILCMFLPMSVAERICASLSFCSLLGIWLISVWMLLRTGTTLTLFVFSCCVFCMLFV